MKPTYIYCLWCPVKRRIRYIGKTVAPGERLWTHLSFARKGKPQYVSRWIAALLRDGKRPRFRVLYRVPDGENWQDHERQMIQRFIAASRPMVNTAEGGGGCAGLTSEQKERQREALCASFTPENRKRRSEAAKARWANPEWRGKTIAAQKAAAALPRNRIRLAKGVNRSPEGEARRLAGLKIFNDRRTADLRKSKLR